MVANIAALLAFAVVALVLLSPRVRKRDAWRATVTPLASIIGSGFLVSLPLLGEVFGVDAPFAMAALVAGGYLLGGVIRFNIRHGEALFGEAGGTFTTRIEQFSHLALAFAYLVSVAYYLSLLSQFALRGVPGISAGDHETLARWIVTALLAALGGWGFLKGLHGLENLEEIAVGFKLAVIAAVIAGLAVYNFNLAANGAWAVHARRPAFEIHDVRVALGLLIIVQGFETSRFLKGAYAPDLRIKTMRWAQWIAAGIYCAFFGLSLVVLDEAPRKADAAAVVGMMAPVASVLPVLLIAGAVFAQLSAAVADAIGGAGLAEEASGRRIRQRQAYPLTAAAGIALVWSTNVFEVITLASRAFAFYYALQCAVAIGVAFQGGAVKRPALHAAVFALAGLLALAVLVFGIPAESAG